MILEIVSVILAGIFMGMSLYAGIGGGTIINTLIMIGMNVTVKESIEITYIFLFGGSLASTIINFHKKTQQGKRLIDYDLIVMTLPMLISGVIFGTMLNNLLSEFTVTLLFLILIIYLSHAVNQKLKQITQKQKNQLNQPLLIKGIEMKSMKDDDMQRNYNNRLQEILNKENELIPVQKLKIILHIYGYTLLILLCKGGTSFDSIIGLDRCSYGTWIFSIFHFVLSFLYSKSIAIKKYQLDMEKQNIGFVFENYNQKMSEKKMRKQMFNGFIAGAIGGTLSIGSGMVLVPIWLKQGVQRNTAAATAGPLIFFSSSVSFLISILRDKYDSFLVIIMYIFVSFSCSFGVISNRQIIKNYCYMYHRPIIQKRYQYI